MDRELREWLSLTPADLFCYLGYGFLIGLYFTDTTTGDATLSTLAILASLIACPLGMRRDPQLSDFTNAMKLISYPLNVLLVVTIVIFNAMLNDGAWRRLIDSPKPWFGP